MGLTWELRLDSPAHSRVRVEAVRAARRVAEEYAQAVGSRLTGLVEISDADAFGGYAQAVAGDEEAYVSSGGRRSVADAVTLQVDPVPRRVAAAVRVRFTLTQPDLS